MEEYEEGLSLKELFHVIWIKKWLLLVVSIFVMLAGVILISALYNPNKTHYVCEYEIKFPGSELGKYPDDTDIISNQLISLEYLKETKESNLESYDSIDINKIADENGISIERYNYDASQTGEYRFCYRISIKEKYFDSSKQAREFITDLTQKPIEYALNILQNIEYKDNLKAASGAADYTTEINYLIEQKELLLDGYTDLITSYTNGFKHGDKSLSDAKAEVLSFFSAYDLESLAKEVVNQGYIKNESYKEKLEQDKENLKREYEKNYLTIFKLKNEMNSFIEANKNNPNIKLDQALQEYITEIATRTTQNVEILSTINNDINSYLNLEAQTATENEDGTVKWSAEVISSTNKEDAKKKFDEKLSNISKALEQFSTTYTDFVHATNKNASVVIYSSSSQVFRSGGMNLLLAIFIFLVIGFIIGAAVNLIIDLPKYLKQKNSLSPKQENPVVIEQTSEQKSTKEE